MRTSRFASRGGLKSRIDRAPRGGVSTNAKAQAPRIASATTVLRARTRLMGLADYIQPLRLRLARNCGIIDGTTMDKGTDQRTLRPPLQARGRNSPSHKLPPAPQRR